MRIDPEIAALRSDKASQHLLRTKMDEAHAAWCVEPMIAAILADLGRYSNGTNLDELFSLQAVMTSKNQAELVIDGWISRFTGVLSAHRLAQLPFRHHHTGGFTSMQLASVGGAALSLSLYAPYGPSAEPVSVLFSDREMRDLVICGEGNAVIYDLILAADESPPASTIRQKPIFLCPGSRLTSIGNCQTRQFERIDQRLVVLQLSRVPQSPSLSREYSIETGALLMQSSGDKRASQQEMAMAVLSELDRNDAVPAMAEMAAQGPDHLRWQALRHVLALDAEQGFAVLNKIADSPDDSLAMPARELRDQLVKRYPQLAEREAA